MITFKVKGDFSKTTKFLERATKAIKISNLDKYGKIGVEALRNATPKDSGKTSESWSYRIIRKNEKVELAFYNSNIQNGVPIAIILQYGHGTGTGGYVKGIDYINPALRPVFDKLAEDAWNEVVKS